MNDLISRQEAMKEFSDFVRKSNNSDFAQTPTWNDAVSLVESMPAAQPEIIRCKDCKYRGGKPIANGRCWCSIHNTFMSYCSDAERRTDETD